MEIHQLKKIVEAALLAAEQPLNLNQLAALFIEEAAPSHAELRSALEALDADCEQRGIELTQVASGYRLQVRQEMQQWISRLWSERRPRYSRALLETLAIIAYRQPMTRGEIEEIRGVSVSSSIMRTLQEREWVRIVGHRDVPGRPALFGTTRRFLDYFSLTSLDKLPTLSEIRDLEVEPELELVEPGGAPESFDSHESGDGGETSGNDRESDDRNEDDAVESGGDPGEDPGNDDGDEPGDDESNDKIDDEGNGVETDFAAGDASPERTAGTADETTG